MSSESLKTRNNLSIDEFEQLIKKEKDVKIYKKLNFLKLKKEGYTTKESCKYANLKKSTAYLTLDEWNEGGYDALLRKKGGGRKSKLNNEQLNELKIQIENNILNSESDVQKFIKKEWDEEYSISGVKKLLKKQLKTSLNENEKNIVEITTELQKYLINVESMDMESNDEINELRLLISREKNSEVLKKLVYLLLRKLGFSNKFTSKLLCITVATGNNWMNKWKHERYDGLKRKKGQGRKCKLTNEEIEILKKN